MKFSTIGRKLVNEFKAPIPGYVAVIGAVLAGIGGGMGNEIWHRKFRPPLDMIDIKERTDIQRAFVREMEDLMSEFATNLSSVYESAVADLEKVKTIQSDHEEIEVERTERVHIFTSHDDSDWNYEEEMKERSPDAPYIIHHDEFHAREYEYPQTTLTYYAGDDVLVDEKDVPIYNYARIVGELKFGHGSQDESIVYVRNEKLEGEYEIILENGHYAIEVLGQEMEESTSKDLKHSVPKFRQD